MKLLFYTGSLFETKGQLCYLCPGFFGSAQVSSFKYPPVLLISGTEKCALLWVGPFSIPPDFLSQMILKEVKPLFTSNPHDDSFTKFC